MEQLIKNIVTGFDFSTQAKEALKVSMALSGKLGAKLTVVTALPGHIDPEVKHNAQTGATPRRDQLFRHEALMENIQGRLEGTVEQMGGDPKEVRCEVSMSKPTQAIFDTSSLYHGDLIVVGATGLGTFERLLVGSTSARLVRKSRWPVLVVKPDQAWPPKRILCPVDFSVGARRALGWAAEMASFFGAHVDVLYVNELLPRQWVDIYGDFYSAEMERAETDSADRHLEQLQAFCDIEDLKTVSWSPIVASGRPEDVIVEKAKALSSDLLCMGTVGRTGIEGALVGNTAERVLRDLPCSMLTAKPDDFVFKK